jgi:hypothetical protein
MVPPDWEHPKDGNGHYLPLLYESFDVACADWDQRKREYDADPESAESFEQWDGERPTDPQQHMPEFAPGTATHLRMYESTSEGTPISPAFATAEELARWLTGHRASAFGSMTATYEQWLVTCNRGSAPSAVVDASGIQSGVAYQGNKT